MADDCAQAYPGLLLQVEPGNTGDQHGKKTLAQVAKQGQDRQFAAGQAQHVGCTGIARTAHARVRAAREAAKENGKGQRAKQVGEQRQ
ncbi:hypothetical protein D3C78_842070 [compost metagenome]